MKTYWCCMVGCLCLCLCLVMMITHLCRTVGCLWRTFSASSSPPCPGPAPANTFISTEKNSANNPQHHHCHHFLHRLYQDISVVEQMESLILHKRRKRNPQLHDNLTDSDINSWARYIQKWRAQVFKNRDTLNYQLRKNSTNSVINS